MRGASRFGADRTLTTNFLVKMRLGGPVGAGGPASRVPASAATRGGPPSRRSRPRAPEPLPHAAATTSTTAALAKTRATTRVVPFTAVLHFTRDGVRQPERA